MKNILIIYQVKKLKVFIFLGRNSYSDILLENIRNNGICFLGHVTGKPRLQNSSNVNINSIEDIDFNNNFAIMIFSIQSSFFLKKELLMHPLYNSKNT